MANKDILSGEGKLLVSSSPHIRAQETVDWLMWQVVIALLPAVIVSIYFFGFRSFYLILLGTLAAVITEAAIEKAMGKDITIKDGSAVVTGLLLAFNLPATAPWWLVIIGSVFAIAVVKQTFGGLGYNFINPALTARAFLLAAWPQYVAGNFPLPLDTVTGATPLAVLKGTAAEPCLLTVIFLGQCRRRSRRTSAVALLAGGLYLIYLEVIDWRTPLSFICTVAAFTGLWW